jgi:hypothetical protein
MLEADVGLLRLGGGGKPQRIMASSRSPSVVRTTGASWSGKMPGSGGRLPVVLRIAPVIRRRASWLFVRE